MQPSMSDCLPLALFPHTDQSLLFHSFISSTPSFLPFGLPAIVAGNCYPFSAIWSLAVFNNISACSACDPEMVSCEQYIWFRSVDLILIFQPDLLPQPPPNTHTHSTKQSAFGKCLHVARKLSGRDILYSCRSPCVPLTIMMLLVEGSRRCRRGAGGEESTVFKSRIHRLPAWLTNIINFLCFSLSCIFMLFGATRFCFLPS